MAALRPLRLACGGAIHAPPPRSRPALEELALSAWVLVLRLLLAGARR